MNEARRPLVAISLRPFGLPATVLLALALASSGQLRAQSEARPQMRAQRVSDAPLIDGDVLGDAVWQAVEPATGFWQSEPFEGQPASEKTEVRVVFNERTLFIGVVCYDSEPGMLAVSDSRRDANLDNEDSFRVILDSFQDHQNGFVFGTNVAGIQHDGQVTGDSGGGRGRGGPGRGGGGGLNLDWNTSWEVRSKVGDFGWSAEMAIPFRSLRYGSGKGPWGINFERNIRRKNETGFWARLERQFDLYRLTEAGSITGIEPPKQRNLQILPYVLGGVNEIPSLADASIAERDENYEIGFDLKYGVTPSVTLDVTYNTDFAQVEADDQQVNLNRFSLFFPEKRPFFLENAGFFRVGSPGSADLFFSRRIGLDDGGVVPIIGGARLSGRAAGLNLGFLNMQTDDLRREEFGEENIHANNFSVARVNREFANRSSAGMLFVNRQGTGELAPEDDYNRTFAVDGQLGIGRYADVSGWVAKTSTPGREGRDHAFSVNGRYNSQSWGLGTGYTEVGGDFNPEVGFLSRSDYRRLSARLLRRIRPTGEGKLKELQPRLFYSSYWDFDGFHETEDLSLGNTWEWRGGTTINLSLSTSLEGLQEPFTIYANADVPPNVVVVPAGSYRNEGVRFGFGTPRARMFRFGFFGEVGGFFNGDIVQANPFLSLRLGDYLSSELSLSRNDVDLDTGSFTTNLVRLRISYSFTTELLLQALIQYNDVSNDLSTNLRFSWIGAANTGLFVVYNEVRERGAAALAPPERSLIIKYSRVFDVFR